MIQTSAACAGKITGSSRHFIAGLYRGSTEIAGYIRKVTCCLGATGNDALLFGAVYAPYIEVVIDGKNTEIQGSELRLDISVALDDAWTTYEPVQIGYFTALNVKAGIRQTTFTAYGRIQMLSGTFQAPAVQSIAAVVSAFESQTGLDVLVDQAVDTSIVIEKSLQGLEMKKVLSVLAGVIGGYAAETNTGGVRLSPYKDAVTAQINVGNVSTEDPSGDDYDFEVTGIKVIVQPESEDEEGRAIPEKSYSRGTVNVTVENEYMTQALFDAMADTVIGLKYRPAEVVMATGDPRLEPGDVLRVINTDGSIFTVPCLNIVHSFDGGVHTAIKAPAPEGQEQVQGQLGEAVKTLKQKVIMAEMAILDRAKITDLEAESARIDSLETEKLDADELEAEVAKLGYAKIDFANVNVAQISEAWIKSLFVQGGVLSNEGTFYRLVGVHINGDLIDANTVRADALLLRGDTGLYYKINVDALGQATASSDEKYQRGIDGSAIVAHSITADEITTQNIQGTGGWINFASGTFAYFNQTNGNGIVWDGEHLTISTDRMTVGNVDLSQAIQDAVEAAEAVQDMQDRMDSGEFKGEDATVLRIDSSRGVLFKNNYFSTVLTVTIQKGALTITTAAAMRAEYGASAYLQWYWRKFDDEDWKVMLITDSHITDDGFTLTVTPDDVDEKIVFKCDLITD